MVSVPVRVLAVLVVNWNRTVPAPVPLAPDVTVIHGSLLRAVHVHPPDTDTVTSELPAAAGTVCASGEIEAAQGAASCVMRTWLSLMTISPSRAEANEFGATRKSTLPLPCPDVGARSEIQLAWVDTVHSHSG